MQMELNLKDVSARRDGDLAEPPGAAAQSSDESSEESPWLEVQFTELQAAIRGMRKLARAKEQAEAVVSFADGKIVIELPAVAVSASAEGVWPGEARVPASFVQGLARSIATASTGTKALRFQIEDERLSVGSYSIPCVWQNAGGHTIHLPADAPFPMLLRLSSEHTQEDIERSGLTPVVESAVARMEKIVARAAETLAPLDIDEDAIRDFVRRSVQRGDT